MTREEARKLLPIIKAFSEGKEIEFKTGSKKWISTGSIAFTGDVKDYRIKPSSTYRPFANKEECWQEILKHQPVGYLKDKEDGSFVFVTSVNKENCVKLNGNNAWLNVDVIKYYTFADGAPFGVKVEEE